MRFEIDPDLAAVIAAALLDHPRGDVREFAAVLRRQDATLAAIEVLRQVGGGSPNTDALIAAVARSVDCSASVATIRRRMGKLLHSEVGIS